MLKVAIYVLLSSVMITMWSWAAPTTEGGSKQMDLDYVKHKSVCPLNVTVDDKEGRTPRRIKVIKCAKTPNPICAVATSSCCGHPHINPHTECVEVIDWVLVKFSNSTELMRIPVSIGCTCIITTTEKSTNGDNL